MPQMISVKTEDGTTHSFHIEAIDKRPTDFKLVNSSGTPAPASFNVTENRIAKIHFFDGVTIVGGEVFTLNTLGENPRIRIGSLVNS